MDEQEEQITKEGQTPIPEHEDQVTPPKPTITEEPLPGAAGEEPEGEGPEQEVESPEPSPILNRVLTSIVAQVAFKAKPAAEGGKPLTPDEMANQYVQLTTPLLDMIEFHKCLGVVGELSPTVRLVVGVGVLVGGIFLVQPPKTMHKEAPVGSAEA